MIYNWYTEILYCLYFSSSDTFSTLSYSAVLARIILREKLHIFGVLGCVLCVVGSTTIVLHAPAEREIESVAEVWDLATEPGLILHSIRLHSTVNHYWRHVDISVCYSHDTREYYLSTILRLKLLCRRISTLCSHCAHSSFRAHIPFCPTVWSDTYYGVYWYLFSFWVSVGMLFTSWIFVLYSLNP